MHEAFEGVEFHALLPVVEPGYAALNAARLPEFAPALVAARNPPAPRIARAMTCKIRIGLSFGFHAVYDQAVMNQPECHLSKNRFIPAERTNKLV